MPGPKLTPRNRILNLLKRRGGLTAAEIAKELGVSTVAARKHLVTLETEGLIGLANRTGSRGRPAVVYAISAAGEAQFPQGYHDLVVDLVQDLSATGGEQQLHNLFSRRNDRLAQLYQIRLADKSFTEAVHELARARDDDGYMASVEEAKDGIVLSEHNCPIYDVAQRFPHACQCERELFERVLHAPVVREVSLIDGASACRYRIEAPC